MRVQFADATFPVKDTRAEPSPDFLPVSAGAWPAVSGVHMDGPTGGGSEARGAANRSADDRVDDATTTIQVVPELGTDGSDRRQLDHGRRRSLPGTVPAPRDRPSRVQPVLQGAPVQDVQDGTLSREGIVKPGVMKRIRGSIDQAAMYLEEMVDILKDCEAGERALDCFLSKEVSEVFSPRRFQPEAQRCGVERGRAYDLILGNDFLDVDQRRKCRGELEKQRPGLLVVSPPCVMYSMLQYLGVTGGRDARMADPEWRQRRVGAQVLFDFAMELCRDQVRRGGLFLHEHPWCCDSWSEGTAQQMKQMPGVVVVRGDQCQFGLTDHAGEPMRKRSGFMTNSLEIARALQRTCPGDHEHQAVLGAVGGEKRSAQAARYPRPMVRAILSAFRREWQQRQGRGVVPVLMAFTGEPPERWWKWQREDQDPKHYRDTNADGPH